MPPHPVVPVYRLAFPYIVRGFPHVMHFYLNVVASADPSGFNTVARAGHANVGVSAAMTAWWNTLKPNFAAADGSFGNARLEHFALGAWTPVFTEVNAIAPTAGGTNQIGGEQVWSLYSTNHERMKVVFQESNIAPPNRIIAFPSGFTQINPTAVAIGNTGAGAVDNDPWSWSLCRDNTYTGTLISFVAALSKHWRRKRGLG